jgi:hypothetical protein
MWPGRGKADLVEEVTVLLAGMKAGDRRIAKPRKSLNLAPSAQSIARSTRVGEV